MPSKEKRVAETCEIPATNRSGVYKSLFEMGSLGWKSIGFWPCDRLVSEADVDRAGVNLELGIPGLHEKMARDATISVQLRICLRWTAETMPVVEVPIVIAAALCASKGDPSLLELAIAPWDCFAIEVPEGLIVNDDGLGGTEAIHTILVMRRTSSDGKSDWSFISYAARMNLRQSRAPTEDFFSDKEHIFPENHSAEEVTPIDSRAMVLCRALIRGVVLQMNDPARRASYRKVLGTSSKAVKARASKYPGMPDFDRYVITDKVMVDARETVRRYNLGQRGSFSLRHLVCGHFKAQAHGPDRKLRRSIWVQPYWRGEEGLPIATKSHVICAHTPSSTSPSTKVST